MANVTVIPATKKMYDKVESLKNKRRAAAYARVSTDSDEQFTSYEAQVDYYTKYILSRPELDFVKVYSDEGVSGLGTKNREGFNEMMNDALAGKIDLIITKSISRFARNTVDTLTAVRKLKEKGIEVWFEKENIQTFDGKGELLITIMSSLAQEESRSISENVTWGKRKASEDGKIYLPYKHFLGYKRGEDNLPEIVPEEAEIVRRIYDMFIVGMTPIGIAKQLTEEKIPTPGGKEKWLASTVSSILTNEKYKGDARLQKTFTVDFLSKKKKKNEGEVNQYYVKNSHPAIISSDVFDRVQREMERRKQLGSAYSGKNIFSCRLVCGDCGAFFGPKLWCSNSKYKRTIWQCNDKFKGDNKCSTPHLTEEDIKQKFMKAYNSLIQNKESLLEDCRLMQKALTDCSKNDCKIEELKQEIDVVETMMKDCINKKAFSADDDETVEAKLSALQQRYDNLSKEYQKELNAKDEKELKANAIGGFMFALMENEYELTDFDARLWVDTIDYVKVMNNGRLIFKFMNGMEVEE